jgi:hypothetical protein
MAVSFAALFTAIGLVGAVVALVQGDSNWWIIAVYLHVVWHSLVDCIGRQNKAW